MFSWAPILFDGAISAVKRSHFKSTKELDSKFKYGRLKNGVLTQNCPRPSLPLNLLLTTPASIHRKISCAIDLSRFKNPKTVCLG